MTEGAVPLRPECVPTGAHVDPTAIALHFDDARVGLVQLIARELPELPPRLRPRAVDQAFLNVVARRATLSPARLGETARRATRHAALTLAVAHWMPRVATSLARRGDRVSREDIQDAVQRASVRLWEKADQDLAALLEHPKRNLRGLFWRIALGYQKDIWALVHMQRELGFEDLPEELQACDPVEAIHLARLLGEPLERAEVELRRRERAAAAVVAQSERMQRVLEAWLDSHCELSAAAQARTHGYSRFTISRARGRLERALGYHPRRRGEAAERLAEAYIEGRSRHPSPSPGGQGRQEGPQ